MFSNCKRIAGPTGQEKELNAKDLTIIGDKEKNMCNNATAIGLYKKALRIADTNQIRYLIPRIMACYRRCSTSVLAIQFFDEMKKEYGYEIMDRVSFTVVAAAFSDINDWDEALYCANQACKLNDGVIDEYLEAVYNRIDNNQKHTT